MYMDKFAPCLQQWIMIRSFSMKIDMFAAKLAMYVVNIGYNGRKWNSIRSLEADNSDRGISTIERRKCERTEDSNSRFPIWHPLGVTSSKPLGRSSLCFNWWSWAGKWASISGLRALCDAAEQCKRLTLSLMQSKSTSRVPDLTLVKKKCVKMHSSEQSLQHYVDVRNTACISPVLLCPVWPVSHWLSIHFHQGTNYSLSCAPFLGILQN